LQHCKMNVIFEADDWMRPSVALPIVWSFCSTEKCHFRSRQSRQPIQRFRRILDFSSTVTKISLILNWSSALKQILIDQPINLLCCMIFSLNPSDTNTLPQLY
jgi:hypothetical protein